MIDRRSEALAAVWSKDGGVGYSKRNGEFPFICLKKDDRLPQTSEAFRAVGNGGKGFAELVETHAGAWAVLSERTLFEQMRVAANGHAVTLLWADTPD